MTQLKRIIHRQIGNFGPMTVAEYMTLCLLHPDHGYYTAQDPMGALGDFTTAPEISQMFGEMLGLCLAQCWQDQGSPATFALCELGPGKGTMMADILRVGASVPGFLQAAEIWLVEVSPSLRAVQQTTLQDHPIRWVDQITDVPETPLFLVANEFFDTLPIRQFQRCTDGWQEQMIGLVDGALTFGLTAPMPVKPLEDHGKVETGDMVETNTATLGITVEISRRLADHGGVALIVDYGRWGANGDTFQAVKAHQKTEVLANPGQADLTAHVDFAALSRAAVGVNTSAMTDQGVLLESLGITARAQSLAQRLTGKALDDHIAAHRRLTHPDEMGRLFKAIALHPKGSPPPPGFEP